MLTYIVKGQNADIKFLFNYAGVNMIPEINGLKG